MASHKQIFDVDDARALAQKRLPRMIFNYIDGAASDEHAKGLNEKCLSDLRLMPRVLINVDSRDLSDKILGMETSLPFGIAPMGMCNLSWPGGDRALARLAKECKIPLCVSTAASTELEKVIELADGNAWFQLYAGQSTDFVDELVDRANVAGYKHFILTVDVPVLSVRNRERRTGFGHPPRMDFRSLLDFALHPHWSFRTLLSGMPRPMNFETSQVVSGFDRAASRAKADWKFLKKLRDRWPHFLIVKGVQSSQDAKRIVSLGADGIYVSNHGGRQLNSAPAVINSLPLIRQDIGKKVPLIFDGGVRRGEDVVKARVCGADFVMVGRPYLYGLGAAGYDGVRRITDILAEEISVTMGLIGELGMEDLGAHNLANC